MDAEQARYSQSDMATCVRLEFVKVCHFIEAVQKTSVQLPAISRRNYMNNTDYDEVSPQTLRAFVRHSKKRPIAEAVSRFH